MNKDTITQWLESGGSLPDAAEVNAMVKAWPWFVPARHMQAALLHHRRPYSKEVLNNLNLYGGDWVSAYRLLTVQDRPVYRQQIEEEPIVAETPIVEEAAITETTVIREDITDKRREAVQPHRHETPLIEPLYTEDYFRHQGIETEAPLPEEEPKKETEDPKTLMVMMSFAEWLTHFKVKSDKEQEEEREKSALRSMWQREKLAAALDEEPEEIPEDVFEMAVSSITREDDLASESLAEILEKQEKWDAAAEMYRKLGLRNPSKSAYFALRAEAVKKKKL